MDLSKVNYTLTYCLSGENQPAFAPPRQLSPMMALLTLSMWTGELISPQNKSQARPKSFFTACSGSPSFTRDSPTRIAPHPVCATKATCSGVEIPLSPAIKKPLLVTCRKHSTGLTQHAAVLDNTAIMPWLLRSAGACTDDTTNSCHARAWLDQCRIGTCRCKCLLKHAGLLGPHCAGCLQP